MIVYCLYHTYAKGDGADEEKLIGIYTTKHKANAAIRRVRGQPGFRDHPKGFKIFEHTLDRDDWLEGFISGEEALKLPES